MLEPSRPPLIFADLLAAVGEVMLRWGYLEIEMLKKLEASGCEQLPRLSPIQQWRVVSKRSPLSVAAWTAEIETAVQIRNLLAHGLVGGYAQPEEGSPRVVCRDIDGERHTVTYVALISAAQNLDLLRLRLRREPDDLLRSAPEPSL